MLVFSCVLLTLYLLSDLPPSLLPKVNAQYLQSVWLWGVLSCVVL
jgi:hypothetical protein